MSPGSRINTAQPVLHVSETELLPERPRLYQPPETLFNYRRSPGYYNAKAKAALLRRSKEGPHDELFVDFSRTDVHVELRAAGIELASGSWTFQASAGGQALTSQGDWDEVFWQRTAECDYLEIELPLSHGWLLERQMVLAREDRFLLLADALLGPESPAVEVRYAHSLPVSENAKFLAATESREGWLETRGGRRAAVVPPALGEWRGELCQAELCGEAGQLTLKQAVMGRHLYAPLWIDLDPRRMQRPLTWRRLTVAENLAIVPRDVATAYRIQAGKQQWLIYRSLAPVGNRSMMGHNTCSSFECSRILATGDRKAIVEIE